MKAIVVRQFGDPGVLQVEDVAAPLPGAGQVVVRVRAVGVNPVEGYVRSGNYAKLPDLPYTPGTDAAGTVESVGEGVTTVDAGDRVYVATSASVTSGTYAEQVRCPAEHVHPLPERISFAQGAAIGVPYATAWRAVHQKARVAAGETILIHGASGGVGVAAVQLARAAGLTVIGTAGSERGLALVHKEGAHHVFDHHHAGYLDEIRRVTGGRGPDVIIEMLANVNLARDTELIAPRGRIIIVGSRGEVTVTPRAVMAKESIVTGFSLLQVGADDLRQIHAGLGAGLALGTLTPIIGREFPLAEASRAHLTVMESGAHGKIVLTT